MLFEIYASQHGRVGMATEVGAFKRAARLSLQSLMSRIHSTGDHIEKNRRQAQDPHGDKESPAYRSSKLLAASMLALAWQFSEDSIDETPAPVDLEDQT